MKQAAIVVAVLGMCVGSWGQDKPATQSAPAGQAHGSGSGSAGQADAGGQNAA